MFRAAELGQTVTKKEYKTRAPDIRRQLLEAQVLLSRTSDFSVMIDIAGVDAAVRAVLAGETATRRPNLCPSVW